MKKVFLFLFIISAVTASAQTQKPSLKDLLYSGKLKMDSNTVIRNTDVLTAKIDTSTKKPAAEAEKAKPATTTAAAADSTTRRTTSQSDVATAPTAAPDSTAAVTTDAAPATTTPVASKSNNQIFKEYMDSLVSSLKTEVLSSKKIKKETYYLYVDYEIGTEGQVTVNNVTASPENSFLQDQVKERLTLTAPQLAPVIDSSGKARKVKRKYNFNITKE